MNGGSGSSVGIVSYGAFRCESVTDAEEPSASRVLVGHIMTIALSRMRRPKPLQKQKSIKKTHEREREREGDDKRNVHCHPAQLLIASTTQNI
jgi:hypothetical protein